MCTRPFPFPNDLYFLLEPLRGSLRCSDITILLVKLLAPSVTMRQFLFERFDWLGAWSLGHTTDMAHEPVRLHVELELMIVLLAAEINAYQVLRLLVAEVTSSEVVVTF